MADDKRVSGCPNELPLAILMTLWLLATSREARRIAWNGVEVHLDLDAMKGLIWCGGRNGGSFAIAEAGA